MYRPAKEIVNVEESGQEGPRSSFVSYPQTALRRELLTSSSIF